MFLLHPSIFLWDFVILILIGVGISIAVASKMWLTRNPKKHFLQKIFIGLFGLLGVCGFLLTVYGSFIEPHILTVTRGTIDLPLKTPLKIAILSDLEVGLYTPHSTIRRAIQQTNDLLPDVVLIAGDFMFEEFGDMEILKELKKLNTTMGVYAVFGNHDSGEYRNIFTSNRIQREDQRARLRELLEEAGVTVLQNEKVTLSLPGESLVIAGIQDVWTLQENIDTALAGIPSQTTTILLSHNPSIISDPQSHKAHLIVSGHTHGGQIRLPFIGALPPIPISIDQTYDQGLFTIDRDTILAITRGLGETNARARLFAWPEIMLLQTK
jgi:uncharacterized protein